MTTSPRRADPSGPVGRVGFGVALTLVMAVSVTMPPAIGVLGPFLVADLGLSRTLIGLLASVLPLVGGILSVAAGSLVDRFGGRRLVLALLLSSGAGMLTFAAAPSLPWLIVASCLGGLALAIGNSATNQLIAEHIPAGQRGVLVGVKQSGVQLAAFVVGAFLPGLAVLLGWRVAAASAASLALITLVVTLGWVPPDQHARDQRPRTEVAQPGDVVARRASWPAGRWVARYAFFMGAGSAAVVTYVPLYAFEEVGVSVTAAGAAASIMAAVAVLARIGWARLAERVWNVPAMLVSLSVVAVAAQVVTIAAALFTPLLWVGVAGLGASAVAWNGVAMLFIVSEAPRGLAGRATGRVQLGFSMGMFSSPLVFGFLVDRIGAYWPGWAVVAVLAATAGVLVVLGRADLRSPGDVRR